MTPVTVGLVGCGEISRAYLEHLTEMLSRVVRVTACCDLIVERAQQRAKAYHIPRVCTTEELIADPDIEMVVNLTMPADHHAITMAALEAGKHVFSEKPLTVNRQLGKEIIDTAAARGLAVAGAADTFLGAALQVTRQLIDRGDIGTPITAQALLGWGPGSERYYNVFTGPLFDMGPYYLTALISLLGSVRRVTGSAQIPFAEQPYPADSPQHGKMWKVTRPGNISGVLDFTERGIGVITTTCEIGANRNRLEIYGSEGMIVANDPNSYTGPVSFQPRKGEPQEVPLPEGFPAWGRGLGVAELACAIRAGRPPRASGALMYHVLDIMHSIQESSQQERHFAITSGCARPEPFDLREVVESAGA